MCDLTMLKISENNAMEEIGLVSPPLGIILSGNGLLPVKS